MKLARIVSAAVGVWAGVYACGAVLKPIPHVEVVGTGPVPMVLIPAFMFDWQMWKPFMERNKDAYTMYAVTLPGFGGSDPPPLKPDEQEIPWIDSATEALAAMIDEKKIQDPIIVGHSLGGHIAVRMGFEWPDKCSKVVTVDGMAAYILGGPPMTPMQRAQTINQNFAPKMHAVSDDEWKVQLEPMLHTMVTSEENARALYAMAKSTPKDTAIEYYLELIKSDLTPWMFKLRRPALAIAATPLPDEQTSKSADALRKGWQEQFGAAENAQVVFFEGARHFIMYDMPEEFDRAIKEFVEGKQVRGARGGSKMPDRPDFGAGKRPQQNPQAPAPDSGADKPGEKKKQKPILPPSPKPGR